MVKPHARIHIVAIALAITHISFYVIFATYHIGTPGQITGDFQRFWQIGTAPGRPYLDYAVEYPPLTLAALKGVATVSANPENFSRGLLLLNVVADSIIAGALLAGWGVGTMVFYMAWVLPMLPHVYFRTDLWSTAAATAAVALTQRHYRLSSAVALVCGVGLKLWPLPLSMWLLGNGDARRRRGVIGMLLVGYVSLGAAWLALGGLGGIRQVATFRGSHGWSIESVVGSGVHLMYPTSARLESGAWRIGTIPDGLTIWLSVLAFTLAMAATYVGTTARRLGSAWIAGVGSLVLCSTLISPQFIVWMVPGAAIAWFEGDRVSPIAVAVAVALSSAILSTYSALIEGALFAQLLVIARNLALSVGVFTATGALGEDTNA